MDPRFQRIQYEDLSPRQQENYNYQKVSALLAEYGFATIRLSDDWNGADFIAQHIDGKTFLKAQLKGRLTFDKKYVGNQIHICFPSDRHWYLYPHDEVLERVLELTNVSRTKAWVQNGGYNYPSIPRKLLPLLEPFLLELHTSHA